MFGLLFWSVVLIVSLFALVKASDYFTESAEKIGLYFGLPVFIIGVTIVAVGTSLPELISSLISVFKGSSEIVIGNVVGSNIANIFLVLGIAAIISKKKMKLGYELIHVDLPILIGSVLLISAMVWNGVFSTLEAILALALFFVYVFYTVNVEKKRGKVEKEIKGEVKKIKGKRSLDKKTILILILSSVFVYLGAHYTVESVINLSQLLNIGTEIIAISAVAFGTSLPELTVTFTAARKGKVEMAAGNVLGSNIFNALAVMGVSGLAGTLIIPKSILSFGIPMMLVASILYLFVTQDREVTKWEGWMFVIFYLFFIFSVIGVI